ncbi:alkaline phosphatase family protein [Solimonas flava]|uniref:alkaline phosphatase family protein n=1 Tax=Solimonas flava TaxID=415849 RepID=UPI0004277BD1|nr:alkaline phosphatase family protein [Solimonas flava]
MRNAALVLGAAVLSCAAPAFAAAPPPKLIVAISIDQFSANLFEQYRSQFRGGLARLAGEGVVFPNGYQSHAATETCPGHSTLLTGRHPAATGIVANTWFAPDGQKIYCVQDDGTTVPGREQGRGPANLRVSTLGEWLHAADPASRTVAVSGKDRAAIMMSGHDPAAVYWWDDERGFNTYVGPGQTAAARLLPVAAFNAEIERRWAKAPPQWRPTTRRCAALDGAQTYGALRLDHRVPPPLPRDGARPLRADPGFQRWLRASPELDRLTLALAEHLVDDFALGARGATDLLAVSLSATDYVGHRYGNQGPEMCEQLAQLDAMLGDFLARLDRRGRPYLVVLSADHGAMDAAERVAERGVPAQRLSGGKAWLAQLNERIRSELKLAYAPLFGDEQALYVSARADAAQRAKIVAAVKAALAGQPHLVAAYTRDEALAAKIPAARPADELSLLERVAESTDAQRSGDLQLIWQPYISYGQPEQPGDTIAGHGSPWNYDRRVPILFWWPGARGFEQSLPVETVDIAPTLAAVVGVATPAVDGVCRDLDRGAASTCALSKNRPDVRTP